MSCEIKWKHTVGCLQKTNRSHTFTWTTYIVPAQNYPQLVQVCLYRELRHTQTHLRRNTFFTCSSFWNFFFFFVQQRNEHIDSVPHGHNTNTPSQQRSLWNTLFSDHMLVLENTQLSTKCVILSSLRHFIGWLLDMTKIWHDNVP